MLARLQKLITIALLLSAFSWLLYFWRTSLLQAVAGFFVITGAYIGFLGLEFIALLFVNRDDPAPRPTMIELLHAWLGESLTAPRVFCWRQPFFSQSVPDRLTSKHELSGKRGVVFIHGFFCNRGFWTPWLRRLDADRAFMAVNLEPLFGSIDGYAALIDDAVAKVTAVSGMPPLLVCHSMGGLAARAWLRSMKSEDRVFHIVTIGSPHRGTWLARFGHSANGKQMRLGGDWHQALDHGMPGHRYSLFTCWYSSSDNIVFPTSTATLPGADNLLVRGAAHVQMAFLPEVMDSTLAMLHRREG